MRRSRIWEKHWMLTITGERTVQVSWKNRVQVDCECECGWVKTVMYNTVQNGKNVSCGCMLSNWQLSWYSKAKLNIGNRFGELILLSISHRIRNNGKKEMRWEYKCDCGNIKEINYENVRSGQVSSCGCIKVRHSTLWMHKTRPYRIWYGMMRSCYSEEDVRYRRRWQKGIEVIKEWRRFSWRRKDNSQYYSDNAYFTRHNPFKNFDKENCKRDICYNASALDLYDEYRE